LFCGDSTQKASWQALFDGQQADLVVTSPPYNVGMPYKGYQDAKARSEYLQIIAGVGHQMQAYLAPGRFLVWNVGVSPESLPHYHVVTLEEAGFTFTRQIVWEKP